MRNQQAKRVLFQEFEADLNEQEISTTKPCCCV